MLALAILIFLFLSAADPPLAAQTQGLAHFYNLEYNEAIGEFRKNIASRPDDPAGYNHLAMSILYREMLRSGALESEMVSGTNPFLRRAKMNPSPEDQKEFGEAILKSMSLSQARLRGDPRDKAALYTLGVAHGLRANFNFLVRKSYMDALRDATQARKAHNRITDMDPGLVDARLVQGVHDYVVGSLPWHIKVVGFLAGFRGDKDQGIRTLEYVAAKGDQNRVDAEVLLCAIYRRERLPKKAVPLLEDLIARYPRNYILRFELAQMYADLGDGVQALAAVQRIEDLRNAGSPGYAEIPAEKVLYARGTIQFWYRDLEQALANMTKVAAAQEKVDLNTATYAWLRVGQIYDLKGQRSRAIEAYRQSVRLAPESDAAGLSRRYLGSPYRREGAGG